MAETDPLVAFCRARIAEDRATATTAAREIGEHWTEHPTYMDPQPGAFNVVTVMTDMPTPWWMAQHIARHDPARVLADCDLKTALIDDHEPTKPPPHAFPDWRPDCWSDGEQWPCKTLRILAAVWRVGPDGAQHPEWRKEWDVDG